MPAPMPDRLATLLAADPAPSAAALLGDGYLAFTVDQGADMERHQGIVAIEGETPGRHGAALFRHQRAAAVQRAARLRAHRGRLARRRADPGAGRRRRAASIPSWTRRRRTRAGAPRTALAATLTDAELLDDALPPERLLYRLFGAEGVAARPQPRALAYGCRCSRARLAGILEGFSGDDLDHMAVDGDIVMTCEFCNLDFRFDRAEVRGKAEDR